MPRTLPHWVQQAAAKRAGAPAKSYEASKRHAKRKAQLKKPAAASASPHAANKAPRRVNNGNQPLSKPKPKAKGKAKATVSNKNKKTRKLNNNIDELSSPESDALSPTIMSKIPAINLNSSRNNNNNNNTNDKSNNMQHKNDNNAKNSFPVCF